MQTVNSYNDKDRLSVIEILQKVGTTEYKQSSIKKYEAIDIDKVKIGGNVFRNYGQYSFIWEKTFVKSPERSANGGLGNLNSYATFLTPHLIMDFSIMSIDDYRKIMRLHYEANEYIVECYDTIYNRPIRVKMYFATEEMAKLYTIAQNRLLPNGQWEEWVDIVGVSDYKVELIGTNNELDLISVQYVYSQEDENGNPQYTYPNGSPVPNQYEEDVYLGEEIVVGGNSTFPDNPPKQNLRFKHWVDDIGKVYDNGVIITVNSPITLYAVWESTTTFTLSFNYGLSEIEKITENGIVKDFIDKQVQTNVSIGNLPNLTQEPSETYNGVTVYPYYNGGWYKHPVKQENMRVFANDYYWLDRDTIIYALYDKKPFRVTYETGQAEINLPYQTLHYGDSVYAPTLADIPFFSFEGWYTDSNYENAFSNGETMPPYSITLYAKWKLKL